MTTLIVARHGNTFENGEPPHRIGWRTDLPLTETGWAQARALGRWLKDNSFLPDALFTGKTRRTRDTALIAMIEAGCTLHIQPEVLFNEIDHGPDENRTEDEVIARIGAQALKDWDERSMVPPGWLADPEALTSGWTTFGDRIVKNYPGCTILAVTSNGVARFALQLAENAPETGNKKLATGALGILQHDGQSWQIKEWNIRPPLSSS